MFIVFLRFGQNRAAAREWMAAHAAWIQRGLDDGVFLMAGSLADGQGGAVLAAGLDEAALRARVAEDPFVIHGVVAADVLAITPSRVAPALASWLDRAQAMPAAG